MERTTIYQFVHFFLPDCIKEGEYLFIDSFLKNLFSQYINALLENFCGTEEYEAIKEKNGGSLFETTEEKFFENAFENISLVIVKMPEPKEWAEAKYLLFALTIGEKPSIRYFVYELGRGSKKGEKVYFVCEWEKNGSHLNYNYLPEPNLEDFVNRVKEILDKDLSAVTGVEYTEKGVENAGTLFEYGYACYEKEEYEAAIECFTKLIELGDKENGYYWRGKANLANGNYDAAIQDLTKAIDLGIPGNEYEANFYDYYLRGKAYYGINDIDAAKKDLDKALEISPSFIEADGVKEFRELVSNAIGGSSDKG